MMRLQILKRGWFTILFLSGTLSIVTAMTLIEAEDVSKVLDHVRSVEIDQAEDADVRLAGRDIAVDLP